MANEPAQVEAEMEAERPYDSGDREAVNQKRKRAASRARQQLEIVKTVMGSAGGRAWFFDKLIMCNIFGEPFEPGMQDVTNYRLGAANVGRSMLADIQAAAPQEYLLMLKENN